MRTLALPALVRVQTYNLVCQEFHQLICPDRKIPEKITAITHITNKMVRSQPKIETVLEDYI